MKRAGFTMIELIFVIVILGILAAVAVPKLVGVKEQADEGVVKAFVGTLNRTIGPAKWSASVMDGNGSILQDLSGSTTAFNITVADTEFPAAFGTNPIVAVTNCLTSSTVGTQPGGVVISTTDNKYHVVCRDGNSSTAPKFWYKEGAAGDPVDTNGTALKLQP